MNTQQQQQPLADVILQVQAQVQDLDDETTQTSSTEDTSEQSGNSIKGTQAASVNMPPHLSSYVIASKPSTSTLVSGQAVHEGAVIGHLEHQGNGMRPNTATTATMAATTGTTVEDDKKREHKKRSKNWTRAETLKLINVRKELDEKFRKSGRKVALWDEVAKALKEASFSRDGQQCKDKWEKLTAGYKEVRDGARDKEDHPFYDELHVLLSWKSYKRESDTPGDAAESKRLKIDCGNEQPVPSWSQSRGPSAANHVDCDAQREDYTFLKPMQEGGVSSLMEFSAIQELLETIVNRQQKFFREILDALDRRDQIREQMRFEREEKWRAEERAQRLAFNNAMLMLLQRLMGENKQPVVSTENAIVPVPTEAVPSNGLLSPKKRSKNWKKSEVFTLIRLRRDMENKFVQSTRRAGLWDELGEKLVTLGIQRDGKQCREKWDKLMAEYKDVLDGRKDKEESPYFSELMTFVVRSRDTEEATKAAPGTSKKEESTCPV